MHINQEYLSALLTSLSAKFNGEVVYDKGQNALRFKHGDWTCWVNYCEKHEDPAVIKTFENTSVACEAYMFLEHVADKWVEQIIDWSCKK